jgi:tRNA (guanine37-N1)-methyltransferase
MLHFSVMTLFPQWIETYCQSSILGRAQSAGIMAVQTVNPRDFTTDVHHKVDDAPYGGGVGMVMMCAPIMAAYESIQPLATKRRVLMMSPLGKRFAQEQARDFSDQEQIVIFCGHYEGIDARIETLIPNVELVSIGDFVLTGGELAALSIIDATTRLLPGALGKDESSQDESFVGDLLEYPQYTRPAEFQGIKVPDILLSGNHESIARWRRKMSLNNTRRYRPDLLEKAHLSPLDKALLAEINDEDLV